MRDAGGAFGPWEAIGSAVANQSGGWSLKDVDLTPYAAETVRIGFNHQTNDFNNRVGSGWYIDDIQILTF